MSFNMKDISPIIITFFSIWKFMENSWATKSDNETFNYVKVIRTFF